MGEFPTIGRIVHYFPTPGDSDQPWASHGPEVPVTAVVVRVWSDECVNLRLLVDGDGTPWVTSVAFSDAPEPSTWNWIK